MKHFLAQEVTLKELLLTKAEKERLLIFANEDYKQTASLLEVCKKLEQYIDKKPFDNLAGLNKDVLKAEALTTEQVAKVAAFHDRFERFLDAYNNVIELMSRKLLYWNALLNEWEDKVDKMLAAKGLL
eukprot:TRINITY_DN42045_c0_g1_i1.p1 TRINITY_DN42045_c0_g1~~TRINITY_DN42045_c0_g1_i1.p1  ORF type:complete len:128 (-),score=78.76 TRINITY_DN42045_c0_g1_i1:65-448(-)